MLKLSIGSVFDHAIALTSYLLALNMNVWLAVGFGLPNGLTAYVIINEVIRDTQEIYIYDVVSSNRYNANDPLSPLKAIYCVINGNNVSSFKDALAQQN